MTTIYNADQLRRTTNFVKSVAATTTDDDARAALEAADEAIAALKPQRRSGPDASSPLGESLGSVRAVEQRSFRDVREYLAAVMDAGQPGAEMDRRLEPLFRPTVDSGDFRAASSGMNTATGSAGGFAVPEELFGDVLTRRTDRNPFLGSPDGATLFNIGKAGTLKVPARTDEDHSSSVTGGLSLDWYPEGGQISTNSMSLRQITYEPQMLAGLTAVSEQLLSKSPVAIQTLIAMSFEDELNAKLFRAFVDGDGAGKPQGLLNSAAKITVAAETGQTAGTITWDNVVKLRSRCWNFGRASWLINYDCLPQIATMTLNTGTSGVAVFTPSTIDGQPDRLLGRPIAWTEHTETLGSEGDIILATLPEYGVALRGGATFAESLHFRWDYLERSYRFYLEVDGSSLWASAMTPQNSTSTISPIVTLAARA